MCKYKLSISKLIEALRASGDLDYIRQHFPNGYWKVALISSKHHMINKLMFLDDLPVNYLTDIYYRPVADKHNVLQRWSTIASLVTVKNCATLKDTKYQI